MVYKQVELPSEAWEKFKAGLIDEEGYLNFLKEWAQDELEEAEAEMEWQIEEAQSDFRNAEYRIEFEYGEAVKAFKNREIHPNQGNLLEEAS